MLATKNKNMKIKKLIIYSVCFLTMISPAFSYIGEKYDRFYQNAISKLYEITPDTWEIRIRKSAEPYGYAPSSVKGISIFFEGRTRTNPLLRKKESTNESFYIIIMPPNYLIKNYIPRDANDPGPSMLPDKLLGEVNGFKIFYKVTGTLDGKIPTWLSWENDIKKTLEIKE